jgi:hypothetical protein
MSDLSNNEVKNELSQMLKNTSKLIKYLEGLNSTPPKQKARIENNIKQLKSKLNIDDLNKIYDLKTDLIDKIEKLKLKSKSRTYLEHLQGWYIRPLINHFDNVSKIKTFISEIEGARALRCKLQFSIPEHLYQKDNEEIISNLQNELRFKAQGKGSIQSSELENKFYSQFDFTIINPLKNSTIGKLNLPCISYNVSSFWDNIKAGNDSVLVTGLCPLSTVSNELGFVVKDKRVIRPDLGFDTLALDTEEIINLTFPPRPIISDYFVIKNILESFNNLKDDYNVEILIWYPSHEYYLDLTSNILKNYLDEGYLDNKQIITKLNEIKIKYYKLIEFIKTELGLNQKDAENKIRIIEVDENCYSKLEQYKQEIDFTFFKYIYGSWVGSELRRELYEQLIIKHIYPTFTDKNVLHLDTSYELWVDMLGAVTVEKNKLKGNYSFINYPAVPSISLSHMRDYNAPFYDKLFLAENKVEFRDRIDRLSKKYILRVAPFFLGASCADKEQNDIINDFKNKLIEVNSYLTK